MSRRAVFAISRRDRFMRLTAAIVRSRGCHCPFKQIDRRPAGRSIEQSAQGKERKMASRPARRAGRCDGKTLASEIPPLSYYGTFPRIVNLFPRSAESLLLRARTNKQPRTKRGPGPSPLTREVYKISPFVPERESLVARCDESILRRSIVINSFQ